ncbi:MAG: 3'(2'),5'-bisphosphate nucleotidase [Deltaproteobacteria bacterium]|nr:3'(2'),5'-bisphosphate nucleotidase [Deltaproteobacteria bacterium]
MRYDDERRVAVDAVIRASQLCRAVRAGELSGASIEKQDKSPVTVADFGTQAVISLALQQAYPNDPVMAEERLSDLPSLLRDKVLQHVAIILPGLGNGEVLAAIDRCDYNESGKERAWILDPVDGTKGFLRGDQYAIALALIENGEVVLGILGCPNLPLDIKQPEGPRGCLFIAVKGEGAVMRLMDDPLEQEIAVSDVTDPERASFCESYESTHSSHSDSARIAQILNVVVPPIRIDSQCKYGIVARGDASIYLRLPSKPGYEEKIWDHAAGWLIVKEAGGTVTDSLGRPLDFSTGRLLSKNKGIVASNGMIHSAVLSAIREVLGSM